MDKRMETAQVSRDLLDHCLTDPDLRLKKRIIYPSEETWSPAVAADSVAAVGGMSPVSDRYIMRIKG